MNSHFLNAAETDRWNAARHPAARRGFLAGRILARSLISGLSGIPVSEVDIEIGSSGKPYHTGSPEWHFSISHSRDLAACAVSSRPVGADIQHMDPRRSPSAIASSFFHPEESVLMKHPPYGTDADVFFDLWAAKEAMLKRTGSGVWDMEELPALRPAAGYEPCAAVVRRIHPGYSLALSCGIGTDCPEMEIVRDHPLPGGWELGPPRIFTPSSA